MGKRKIGTRVYFEPELDARLEKLAKKTNMSKSAVIEIVVEESLFEHEAILTLLLDTPGMRTLLEGVRKIYHSSKLRNLEQMGPVSDVE